MKQATLYLLMGLPGSGKTTLAKIIAHLTDAVHVSSDEYRLKLYPDPCFSQKEHDSLYAILDHNIEHLLQANRSVIYDANLNRKVHRDEKYELAEKYDIKVVLWWICVSDKVAKQRRISDQNQTLVPEGETPGKMFDRIAKIFEPPEDSETFITIDGNNITKDEVAKILKSVN